MSDKEKEGPEVNTDELEEKVKKQRKEIDELKQDLKKIENSKVETKKVDKDQRLARFKQLKPEEGEAIEPEASGESLLKEKLT